MTKDIVSVEPYLKNLAILSHRGLNLTCLSSKRENTYQAFLQQIEKGFGLEFDINLTLDGELVVFHDSDLSRFSNFQDSRFLKNIESQSFLSLRDLDGSRFCTFKEVLQLILDFPLVLSALHVKAQFQTMEILSKISETLLHFPSLLPKLLIFDLTPTAALFIKRFLGSRGLSPILGASVADPFDIERFSYLTGDTLISIEEVIAYKDLFDWCWLDEWDRISPIGEKTFLTRATFETCRDRGFKIGLVTPELHASHPNECWKAHQDSASFDRLESRFNEILQLCPDAVCTDYPEMINVISQRLMGNHPNS